MGRESAMLFNHEQIRDVVVIGYSCEERDVFITTIPKVMDKTQKKTDR